MPIWHWSILTLRNNPARFKFNAHQNFKHVYLSQIAQILWKCDSTFTVEKRTLIHPKIVHRYCQKEQKVGILVSTYPTRRFQLLARLHQHPLFSIPFFTPHSWLLQVSSFSLISMSLPGLTFPLLLLLLTSSHTPSLSSWRQPNRFQICNKPSPLTSTAAQPKLGKGIEL